MTATAAADSINKREVAKGRHTHTHTLSAEFLLRWSASLLASRLHIFHPLPMHLQHLLHHFLFPSHTPCHRRTRDVAGAEKARERKTRQRKRQERKNRAAAAAAAAAVLGEPWRPSGDSLTCTQTLSFALTPLACLSNSQQLHTQSVSRRKRVREGLLSLRSSHLVSLSVSP